MPGSDSYYASLGKPATNGAQSYSGGPKIASNIGSPMQQMAPGYTQAQPGGSPDQAGSGFVNLSQLLSLNGASGAQSAQTAAQNLRKQGDSAEQGITSAQDNYNKAVAGATVNAGSVINGVQNQAGVGYGKNHIAQGGYSAPTTNQLDATKAALDKANAGYMGPNSLSEQPGYDRLSKQVSDAQNRAQNATSGVGEAAQIAQDTGLSPRQAAASAFYQGVTNSNLQHAGQRYSGLNNMLNAAGNDSINAADFAKQQNQQAAGQLNDYYNSLLGSQAPGTPSVSGIDFTPTPDYPWASHQRGNSSEIRDVDPQPAPPDDPTSYLRHKYGR